MGVHGSKTQKQAQVLMLGLDGAGKTTLLYKLKYNESVVTVPTVGFNVEMLETQQSGPGLTVWDVGGQRKMRPHWRHHYADTAGLVFVVDSWDLRRLDEARKELHQVLRYQSLRGVPLVVLANKQDLPGALSPAELSLRLDLSRVCGDRSWYVQPCSATTGFGLEEGFRRIVYLLKSSLKQSQEDIKNKLRSKGHTVMEMKPDVVYNLGLPG
uniref:ADP-ribosylation factor-like protein 14 n=1 Tax=Myripristis murdjan TaxID=586833 RepID=A0A667YDX2_9TELE